MPTAELLQHLTPNELALADMLMDPGTIWAPQPGPQLEAYFTEADICFYGGSAGGGKTDLSLGLALTAHQRTVIFRRVYPQLKGIIERLKSLTRGVGRYNNTEHVWRGNIKGVQRVIELESIQYEDDKNNQQGRDRDLHVFDEITHFSESQVRFVIGWNRTADETQRTRVLMAGNPPTDPEGEWVVAFFAPWLDPTHPNPARPGELRWFVVDKNGKDQEVPNGTPLYVDGANDPATKQPVLVQPRSRTFIPARVTDNEFYMKTGYMATLQALPEPLRSRMLEGKFDLRADDNPWQVIPTAWVEEAQARWTPEHPDVPLSAIGVDVAHGGADKSVISQRFGWWFAELLTYPGVLTPDGDSVAALVSVQHDGAAPIFVDATGVGASAYDSLKRLNLPVYPVINSSSPTPGARDMSGALTFANLRAESYWRMREALDPKKGLGLALPPSRTLKADLCAARWKLTPRGIQVELKEEIVKRIGRSPDEGDAAVQALMTPVLPPEYEVPGSTSYGYGEV